MSATSAPDARRRVMVAMSGGVDSSVAAALCVEAGHDVVGVTLRLWGGESDSGCCSVSDVEDARRVAHQLDIDHHVFNLADDFARHVVGPYVAAHAEGRTPNPCIECNRHLKFDRLLSRATALGFDAVATGHHARVVTDAGGVRRVARGADAAKDQSYVLYMLRADALGRVALPVGAMTKDEVRQHARRLGLATASKPDSQDVWARPRRLGGAAPRPRRRRRAPDCRRGNCRRPRGAHHDGGRRRLVGGAGVGTRRCPGWGRGWGRAWDCRRRGPGAGERPR